MNAAVDIVPTPQSPDRPGRWPLLAAVDGRRRARGQSHRSTVLAQDDGPRLRRRHGGAGRALRLSATSSAAELMRLEPAFDLLPPRRRRAPRLRAGACGRARCWRSSPIRSMRRCGRWLEVRVPLRARMGARRARRYRGIHRRARAGPARHRFGGRRAPSRNAVAAHALENLSLASISEDSSPIVKLVHSTVFDALRAGASDVHLETDQQRPGDSLSHRRRAGACRHRRRGTTCPSR